MRPLTEFGKTMRIIRLYNNAETMRDMADKLGVPGSYISAIERGKKPVPIELCDKIIDIYQLSDEWADKLKNSAEESMPHLKIDFRKLNMSIEDEKLLKRFIRNFNELSIEQKNAIREILDI